MTFELTMGVPVKTPLSVGARSSRSVEEFAEQSLMAEDIECKEDVYEGISGDDPFVSFFLSCKL
jgi:hypothetical protein